MTGTATTTRMHYTLRAATAMCFIGHGAFGLITKQVWCNYFAVFGIGKTLAYTLMPWLGSVDILLGLTMLLVPIRAIPVWLVIWGTITAMLRPLSGEPLAEFIERAGNFGAPLGFLMLYAGRSNARNLFARILPGTPVDETSTRHARYCLQFVVFALLAGHGWLNLIEKKGLISQYTSLGFSNPAKTAFWIGISEVVAALIVLIKPLRPLLLVFLVWKMGSELFYPHWELFEWIERSGSYGSILALWFALSSETDRSHSYNNRFVPSPTGAPL